jgi:Xaa-Pro dipeptidase
MVQEKLDTALLPAMRAHGINMWIVLDRENHLDPVHEELGGGYAGVRGAFIFFDQGKDKPEKIFLGSHEQGDDSVITQSYDIKKYYGYSKAGLTPLLQEIVFARKPKHIGINTSATLPDGDGLTVALKDYLIKALGPVYASRLTSAELLVRDFRTTRCPLELAAYRQLLQWTDRWEKEALSSQGIHVGKTTAMDIAWWLEDRAVEEHLVDGESEPRIVRGGDLLPLADPTITVQPGDLINIDGGLRYLGLETDIKRTVYVLKPGETAPPVSIERAFEAAVSFSDVYASMLVPGTVGHVVWEKLAEATKQRGYAVGYPDTGSRAATSTSAEIGVYGHSTGSVAHDIGARIAQDWPFAYGDRVDYPLRLGEWESIEFHVSTPIPEWGGKTYYARFEENVRVGEHGAEWLIPRQQKLLVLAP